VKVTLAEVRIDLDRRIWRGCAMMQPKKFLPAALAALALGAVCGPSCGGTNADDLFLAVPTDGTNSGPAGGAGGSRGTGGAGGTTVNDAGGTCPTSMPGSGNCSISQRGMTCPLDGKQCTCQQNPGSTRYQTWICH
jgi:hypothetical protein